MDTTASHLQKEFMELEKNDVTFQLLKQLNKNKCPDCGNECYLEEGYATVYRCPKCNNHHHEDHLK